MTSAEAGKTEQVHPPPIDPAADREYLWRQYNLWIELYKFHMELVLKASGFYFFVTGGMLTFAYSSADEPVIRASLMLPALMGVALVVTFFYGAVLAANHRRDVLVLAQQLGFAVAPDVNALRVVLWSSAVIFALISIGLFSVIIWA
jgi:hypothetical protein